MAANQISSGVAGRYANALFDLASENNDVAATADGLSAFEAMITESGDLRSLLNSPITAKAAQLEAVSALATKAGIAGLALNFVKLMAANRRLPALSSAIMSFQALVAKSRGEAVAEVRSAEKLSAAQLMELKAALKAKLGQTVTLNTMVDPSLLGGLIVKVGSRMLDNSLATKLQNLKVSMKGTG